MSFVWELHFGLPVKFRICVCVCVYMYVCMRSLMIYLGKTTTEIIFTYRYRKFCMKISMQTCIRSTNALHKQHNYSSDKLVFNWVSNII